MRFCGTPFPDMFRAVSAAPQRPADSWQPSGPSNRPGCRWRETATGRYLLRQKLFIFLKDFSFSPLCISVTKNLNIDHEKSPLRALQLKSVSDERLVEQNQAEGPAGLGEGK